MKLSSLLGWLTMDQALCSETLNIGYEMVLEGRAEWSCMTCFQLIIISLDFLLTWTESRIYQ